MYDAEYAKRLWDSLGPPDHAVPREVDQIYMSLGDVPADLLPVDINPDKDAKITVRVVGPDPEPVSVSLEKAHVAQELGKVDGLMRKAIRFYREKGAGATFAEDLIKDLGEHCAGGLIDAFSSVVDHTFQPTMSPRSKLGGFNIPFMTLVENVVLKLPRNASVLVVEGRQRDIKRIGDLMALHGRHDMSFFFQSSSKLDFRGASTRLLEIHGTALHVLEGSAYMRRFECVLMPVNFAHVLHRFKDGGTMARNIRRVLRPGGLICGTYVDVEAVRQAVKREEYSGGFVMCQDCPDKGVEGSITSTYESSAMFEDFVLMPETLKSYADPSDELRVMDAVRFFRNYNSDARGDRAGREAVELMRVVTWTVSSRPQHVPRLGKLQWACALSPTIEPWGRNPMFAPRGRTIHPNRGLPFGDVDLFYLNPADTVVNRKVDGVEVVMVFGETSTVLRFRGDTGYFAVLNVSGQPYLGPAGYAVQLEFVGERLHPNSVWLTDVLVDPGGDIGYLDRMERFELIIAQWNLPIRVPARLRLKLYCQDLGESLPEQFPTDGYVLNHIKAPPVIEGREYGPARYLKDRYTLDVRRGGAIMEVYSDTMELVTHKDPLRSDKDTPNDSSYISIVKRAWTTSQFRDIVRMLAQPPDSFVKIVDQTPSNEMPYYQLTMADLVYYWVPWRLRTLESAMIAALAPRGDRLVQIALCKLSYQMSAELKRLGISAPTDFSEVEVDLGSPPLPLQEIDYNFAPPTPLCDEWAASDSKTD